MKEQIEKQAIEEMAYSVCRLENKPENCASCMWKASCENYLSAENYYTAGYRKQSENVIELPCKAGDLVHFKGLETPWKVSAIHIYEEGQPQISITSETGKITSTMTANEFYMFCSVLTKAEAKMKGGAKE